MADGTKLKKKLSQALRLKESISEAKRAGDQG